MTDDWPRLCVVTGPTGVGKTELALRLAMAIGGEIVNFDSIQIFRGFDIGSAKPTAHQRSLVPHHLFDLVHSDDAFDAARFSQMASEACREIGKRGAIPILTGGTGFYLRAFLSGLPEMPPRNESIRKRLSSISSSKRGAARLYRWLRKVDPIAASRLPPGDRHRIERALEVWVESGSPISSWQAPRGDSPLLWDAARFAVTLPPADLSARLDSRVELMYQEGLVEEARGLLLYHSPDAHALGSIGYSEVVRHLQGEMTIEAAMDETKRRTRAYAKRQRTWLRAEKGVLWIDNTDPEHAFTTIMQELRRRWPGL